MLMKEIKYYKGFRQATMQPEKENTTKPFLFEGNSVAMSFRVLIRKIIIT